MPGTLIFKPIQAHFNKDNDNSNEKIDAYCKFKVGHHSEKTSAVKNQDSQAEWMEPVKLERKHDENIAKLKVEDHGKAEIDLSLLGDSNKMTQWFQLKDHGDITGEILVEIEYVPQS